jgi:hypothetical protein
MDNKELALWIVGFSEMILFVVGYVLYSRAIEQMILTAKLLADIEEKSRILKGVQNAMQGTEVFDPRVYRGHPLHGKDYIDPPKPVRYPAHRTTVPNARDPFAIEMQYSDAELAEYIQAGTVQASETRPGELEYTRAKCSCNGPHVDFKCQIHYPDNIRA